MLVTSGSNLEEHKLWQKKKENTSKYEVPANTI